MWEEEQPDSSLYDHDVIFAIHDAMHGRIERLGDVEQRLFTVLGR
ncbi:MAG TPA: hypothetical protein VN620_12585 [Candidatus Methylomirabilis sp.]|nr:hypothetical protein [Candidatus Methylomirabilis sp.]